MIIRKLIIVAAILFVTIPVYAQETKVIRLSEPVETTETYEVFGEEVENWETILTLQDIINDEENFMGAEVTVETEVAEVCEKKGCFFVANDDEYSARITFKEYSFFIPTDSQGKKVKLVGVFEVKELTEERAKHFAEDAGNDPDLISDPQKEYAIVATSVMIPKSLRELNADL